MLRNQGQSSELAKQLYKGSARVTKRCQKGAKRMQKSNERAPTWPTMSQGLSKRLPRGKYEPLWCETSTFLSKMVAQRIDWGNYFVPKTVQNQRKQLMLEKSKRWCQHRFTRMKQWIQNGCKNNTFSGKVILPHNMFPAMIFHCFWRLRAQHIYQRIVTIRCQIDARKHGVASL